jgi:glycosyltransferase involved in cell wall biosynthesis
VKPRVSVVTPYKDGEAHLVEAIGSVETQTESAWELLLVDDGSSDGSRAIADAAAARDPRIRSLVRPPDAASGAAGARNWGVRQARGEFLVFLDADDRFLRDKLATELALMDRHPDAAMVCGGTIWWYPDKERRNWSDEIRSLGPGVLPPPVLLDRVLLLQRAHVPCLCAVMVRKEALGGADPFEERFRLYEDQAMLVRLALERPVYVGRHLTAFYRQHSGSTSSRAEQLGDYDRKGRHGARTDFLQWIRTYAEGRDALESSTREAIAVAQSAQSGDRSALNLRQRAQLFRFGVIDALGSIVRLGRRLMRRLKARSALYSTRV